MTMDLTAALRRVTQAKDSLRRTLKHVQTDATTAITALDQGRMPFTSIIGVGPLGSQNPFQVTAEYQQLRGALDVAHALGATEEQMLNALAAADD